MVKKTIYDVSGKRWTDSFGNTYHTARVVKYDSKGKEVYDKESPVTYGYDSAYLQTAEKIMYPKIKDNVKRGSMFVEDRNKGKIEYSAVDVSRKRDL